MIAHHQQKLIDELGTVVLSSPDAVRAWSLLCGRPTTQGWNFDLAGDMRRKSNPSPI